MVITLSDYLPALNKSRYSDTFEAIPLSRPGHFKFAIHISLKAFDGFSRGVPYVRYFSGTEDDQDHHENNDEFGHADSKHLRSPDFLRVKLTCVRLLYSRYGNRTDMILAKLRNIPISFFDPPRI
jgi:hypothetical protein